jgi:alginate O-acetyltransferase complex protein AlgJ
MKRLPPRKIIPLIAFGLLMASAIPVNWSFIEAEGRKLGLIDTDLMRLTKGKVAEELTAKYNASSPFKDFGIEAFGSLSYFAFNEARSGAQIGDSGVLFSNEEFETGPMTAANIDRAVKHIAAVKAALDAKGVTLLIAPVPLKADIEAGQLGSLRLPAELDGRYARIKDRFDDAKIRYVDLRARFMKGQLENRMFLQSDTHWTPAGAALAAEAVAEASRALDLPGEKAFTLTQSEPRLHEGDLRKFVRMLPLLESFGPAHDMLSLATAEAAPAASGGDLFGDEAASVVLVGTSYSANASFGFEAHLKAALQRDVLNLAEEGKGPFAPMQAFLKGAVLKDAPPRLVIWEMPIRYMDDTFPAEQFTLPVALP